MPEGIIVTDKNQISDFLYMNEEAKKLLRIKDDNS